MTRLTTTLAVLACTMCASPWAHADAPSSSSDAPSSSEVAPSSSEVAPSSSKVAPSSSEVAPSSSPDAPLSSEDAPSSSPDAPSASEDAPSSSPDAPSSTFSFEKDIAPWVTTAVGVSAMAGALAMMGVSGFQFASLSAIENEISSLEESSGGDDELARAQLLQEAADVRRKDWNLYGLPIAVSGAAMFVVGVAFTAGGIALGVSRLNEAE